MGDEADLSEIRVEPILRIRDVSKNYGSSVALAPLSFDITPGAIHGFLGKNGAGKSTLVGIIAGSIGPTTGQILFRGKDITGLNLAQRRELGIHLLGQHPELVPSLTVAENLLLPDYPRRRGLVDWADMHQAARQVLKRYGLDIDVGVLAGRLGLPDQRKLSIVRTLREGGELAMLDEPTTALSRSERRSLFDWMRDLNADGQTFIFISHFNNEIQENCTEYTVFRDGHLVAKGGAAREVTSADLSKLVTGTNVEEFHRGTIERGKPLFEVNDLDLGTGHKVNVAVTQGEIVGLVGLPGSGAREFARALAGLTPDANVTVTLGLKTIRVRNVRDAARNGIVYLTSDRAGEGLVTQFSVQESMHLGHWPTKWGLLNVKSMRETYISYRDRLSLRVSGSHQKVAELSGGNQQKVLLGRLLSLKPKILILDEPTLGIDVGTKEEVHRLINELTEQGMGALILAYDTDEMIRLVDRALAFQDGRVVRELSGADLTIEGALSALEHVPSASVESEHQWIGKSI